MKILNRVLFYAKVLVLLVAFSLILYIGLTKMDFTKESFLIIIPMILPFFIMLILFVTTFFFDLENDILSNLSSLLSFIAVIIIALRTIFDKNIISSSIINLDFYTIQETRIKILMYLVLVSNLLLTYYYSKKNKIHS